MITNYDRYFGTPAKAADSISRLVDYHDVSCKTGGEGVLARGETRYAVRNDYRRQRNDF